MSATGEIYTPIICPVCRMDSVSKSAEHGIVVVHCRICGSNFGFDLDTGNRLTDP